MKWKIIIAILSTLGLWSTNNFFLNLVSQSERDLVRVENELGILKREHGAVVMDYDKGIDLEEVKKKLEAQGFKQTRDINYFKIQQQETDK